MGLDAFFYCSELSRAAAEKTFGTASLGETWLLLEYPFAWGRKALDDSNLSPPIKAHLQKFIKTVRRARVLFIKQGSVCHERVSLFVVRSSESAPSIIKFELEDYRQLIDIDLAAAAAALDLTLTATTGGPTPLAGAIVTKEPLYLVCTHGRRDKCCAKFGNPLFKALRDVAGETVWQSSHVGGDRFAGNLVCFPHGLFYSHMTPEAGESVMKDYGAGRLSLSNYRGRACYPYPVQAAEFFVRSESGVNPVDALRRLDAARLDEERWQVRFRETAGNDIVHRVEVSRYFSDFENHITCHSAEARRVPQFRLDVYEKLSV